MRKLVFILIILVTMVISAYAQGENYCYDKESWKEWTALVLKYPHDMDIQMLHAVRIGFCKKVEDGTISFEKARDIFNHFHETVIKNAEKAKELRENNKLL